MAINSLNASSHGISGLVSGIDTQTMVEKLLSGTKGKIVAQQQKKMQLTYKQQLYRGITTQLVNLQNQFFKFSSGSTTNLNSTSFFNSMTAKTESSHFKVTAGSSANVGSVKVKVKQLAQATTLKSKHSASGDLTGGIDSAKLDAYKTLLDGSEISFTVGDGAARSINISSIAGLSESDAVDKLNQLLTAEGINVVASNQNGKFSFSSTDGQSISVTGNEQGQAFLGIKGTQNSTNGTVSVSANTKALLPSLNISLDGASSKTIYFDPFNNPPGVTGTLTTLDKVKASLEKELKSAFGEAVKIEIDPQDSDKFRIFTPDSSRQITISGKEASLDILGLTTGQSNKISSGMRLSQLSFKDELIGDSYKFSINGVDFSFTADQTLSDVLQRINTSAAGVKISYSPNTDNFTMESTASGKGGTIEMKQTQGNFLSALFGSDVIDGNTAVGGSKLDAATAKLPTDFASSGGTINLVINGNNVSVTIPTNKDSSGNAKNYSTSALVKAINTELLKDSKAAAAGVQMTYNSGDGTVSLTANSGADVVVDSNGLLGNMGFVSGQTTNITESTKASLTGIDPTALKIDGQLLKKSDGSILAADSTIGDIKAALQNTLGSGVDVAFDANTSSFSITQTDGNAHTWELTGDDGKLFGGSNLSVSAANGSFDTGAVDVDNASFAIKQGVDAEIEYNGETVIRSSNDFTIDGLTFTLTSVSVDKDGNEVTEEVNTTRNTDQIYEGITKFVEEYNKVIDSMYTLIREDPTYKDYLPLTDEQKSAMSDREIELWEEKSKEGLLRGDSTINSVLADLRSTIYKKPAGSDYAIYSIGISTSAYTDKPGQLEIDESKLREMIATHAEDIGAMFAGTDGLASKLSSAIDRAAKYSPVATSAGSLVAVAGRTGYTDSNSSIFKQIEDINDNITSLNNRYDQEYTRYWRQFNAMEQMIQSMNQQSSWLASQFA